MIVTDIISVTDARWTLTNDMQTHCRKVGEVEMSDWHRVELTPQGWQCPICKRVYSPTTLMCYYCGNGGHYTILNTGDAGIDWLHHESETKSEKPKEGR